ncbi:AAA family ATPase [Planosporangium sp. 12N6]|uniref:AAA family ATPase n=1 Tax=Planosporangium spinosum TaxID=3402278 RepID=UPI003CEC0261
MGGRTDAAADRTDTRPLPVTGPLPVSAFVPLAIDIAWALDDWHRQWGPHTALSPDTIRLDPAGGATVCPAGPGAGRNDAGTGGNGPAAPAYAAPEQTGRLARGADERTDLYALGILYRQLLSGRPPVHADTPAGWRRPFAPPGSTPDPTEPQGPAVDPATPLPPALDQIITLLLENSPDDRYQTARGLALDLERCRDALAAGDTAAPRLLHTRDLPGRLVFSGRPHGRERQLSRLQAAYDRVVTDGVAQLVAVTADSGLGEWTTVTGFTDSVVTGGGLAVRAVCTRDDAGPYAALSRLLGDLAGQLADAPAEQHARIADAVGSCGATLAELVPALRTVVGDRTAPDGSIAAAGYRLRLATRRLLGAVSTPTRPLVIALRDVQWADEPTVELLRYVLAVPDSPPVLAVVTYRPADVGAQHPLQALLTDERIADTTVALRPLADSALAELLGETLGAGKQDASRLSRTVAARTGSSPLLVETFLHGLAERGLLKYSSDGARWEWSQRLVDDEPGATDLAGLIDARLRRFDAGTRDLLELAAVLGPEFDPDILAAATAALPDGPAGTDAPVGALLRPAVLAGMVSAGAAAGAYRWRHEEVRQAVLGGVGERRRARLRLAAGRALRPHPERLFESVAHLNAATDLIPDPPRRRELAALNLAAGTLACRVGAPAAACGYFAAGLDLLGLPVPVPPGAGDAETAELALRLYLDSAGAVQAMGHREQAGQLLELAGPYATGDLDRARLLGARAALCGDAGDADGALRMGIEALRLLGLPVPADPARWPAAAGAAMERLRQRAADGALEVLADTPDCTDPRVVLAAELIATLARPLWPDGSGRDLLAAAGIDLAVEYGPTPVTGYTLARLAAMLDAAGHDRETSGVADLGRRLLARPGTRFPAVIRAAAAVVGPAWRDSPVPMLRELYAAYRTAVEEGEVRLAQRLGAVYTVHRFAVGTPLDQVAADIEARARFAARHGRDEPAAAVMRVLDDAVNRLRGLPAHGYTPTAPEAEAEQRILRGEFGHFSIVGLTPMLAPANVLGDPTELAAISDPIGQVVARAPRTFLTAEATFWHAFSMIRRCEAAPATERASLRTELAQVQHTLDHLAAQGHGIYRARALLVAAERARLAGDADRARTWFDRAVAAARESGVTRTEAFAAERGGLHALACGKSVEAVAYLRRARACYQQWGADAKLDQLDGLLADASRPAGTSRPFDQLDLLTVVRAFQSISSELHLDRLVRVLLELLVQHSPAERGYLLLAGPAGLELAAAAELDRQQILRSSVDGPLGDRVPMRIVEHAGQHRRVLAGGSADLAAVAADPYLERVRPRSALCAPIVRRGDLLAVVYLEHRRLEAAFSTSYLELLDLLCTQAAIALENATVHARLVEANRILDATFDRMPVGLVLLGPDLTVRRASPQAVEIMGLPIAPGTPLVDFFDVLTPADLPGEPYRLEPGLAAVSTWTEPINREVVILNRSGERLRLSTSAIPLRDEAGTLVGVTFLVSPTE